MVEKVATSGRYGLELNLASVAFSSFDGNGLHLVNIDSLMLKLHLITERSNLSHYYLI